MPNGRKGRGLSRGNDKPQCAPVESESVHGAQDSAEESAAASPPAAQGGCWEGPSTSQGVASTPANCRDSFTRNTSMLLHFILDKYEKRKPIMHAELKKLFTMMDKPYFPSLLRRAFKQLELVYGLELEHSDPRSQSYSLVTKPSLSSGENLIGISELPKKGLLMYILGVIFLKGNCASEEDVWEFLNVMGVYSGYRHFIFGDPLRLITRDFVQQNYLEYRQLSGGVRPRYGFLWGPRAYTETTKMKVLEALATIRGTTPSAFPDLYKEALEGTVARERTKEAAATGTVPNPKVHAKSKATDYSHT